MRTCNGGESVRRRLDLARVPAVTEDTTLAPWAFSEFALKDMLGSIVFLFSTRLLSFCCLSESLLDVRFCS